MLFIQLFSTVAYCIDIQQTYRTVLSQDQETGILRQEEKGSTAEKRKQCELDTDVGIKPSCEAESSSKKTRVDDYFVKKTPASKASRATATEDDDAGNVFLKF